MAASYTKNVAAWFTVARARVGANPRRKGANPSVLHIKLAVSTMPPPVPPALCMRLLTTSTGHAWRQGGVDRRSVREARKAFRGRSAVQRKRPDDLNGEASTFPRRPLAMSTAILQDDPKYVRLGGSENQRPFLPGYTGSQAAMPAKPPESAVLNKLDPREPPPSSPSAPRRRIRLHASYVAK